jgi:hypothetical protein
VGDAVRRDRFVDWAAQRIKNLDLLTALRTPPARIGNGGGGEVTTLIERFHYPRLGPGQMWERCRDLLAERGVETVTGTGWWRCATTAAG